MIICKPVVTLIKINSHKRVCNIIFMSDLDCNNCVMVDQKKFNKNMKCCSFLPFVTNFSVEFFIQNLEPDSMYLQTRLGLIPKAIYVENYKKSPYGQNLQLKCEFLEQGRCKVWSHRPSVCKTYFCNLNESEMSYNDSKFQNLESHLAQIVLFEMGYNLKEVQYEIEIYNKLIEADCTVCYPFEVDSLFYKKCHYTYSSIKNWDFWLDEEQLILKDLWEKL